MKKFVSVFFKIVAICALAAAVAYAVYYILERFYPQKVKHYYAPQAKE